MTDTVGWRILRAGALTDEAGAPGSVLAVDFGQSRSDAGFPELMAHLDTPWTVLETVSLATGLADRDALVPDVYLTGWTRELAGRAEPVRAVFGYCMGSSLALALARWLAARQEHAPVVILFDPEHPAAETLCAQFDLVVEGLAEELGAAELAGARARARRVTDDSTDPVRTAAALAELYHELAVLAFTRAELEEEMAAEAADRFGNFLAYLVAAHLAAEAPWTPEHVAVLSATPGGAARHAVTRHSFDVPRQDLLRRPEVGRILSELLGGNAAQAAPHLPSGRR
ncbi:hypothetical protein ACFZB9_22810 [Kitasatospora sp. NPDC008050]|uniref:hypothetical protein n=1 Tax=Kitasatospora sp. NPDC008050 TaxID=3364021 RepID=UPI0036EECA6D